MDILESSKVKMIIGVGLAIGAVAGIAYYYNSNSQNDAKLYPNQLVSFLKQTENTANQLNQQFNIVNKMDTAKKYVKIDGQATKTLDKKRIVGTYLVSTGSIAEGDTIGMPSSINIKDGQVAIGLFTTANDVVSNCTNKAPNIAGTIVLSGGDFANNTDDDEDLCRGFDTSVSRVVIVGNPNDIKDLKANVFDNSSSVLDITVSDGTNAYSGLVVQVK